MAARRFPYIGNGVATEAVTDVDALDDGTEPVIIIVRRIVVSGVLTIVGCMTAGAVVVTVVFVVFTV